MGCVRRSYRFIGRLGEREKLTQHFRFPYKHIRDVSSLIQYINISILQSVFHTLPMCCVVAEHCHGAILSLMSRRLHKSMDISHTILNYRVCGTENKLITKSNRIHSYNLSGIGNLTRPRSMSDVQNVFQLLTEEKRERCYGHFHTSNVEKGFQLNSICAAFISFIS